MGVVSEFRHQLTASEHDTDALEHVNNVVYVRWVQDVALAHSASVGFDMAAYRSLGAAFVVRKHEIEFIRPTYAGEQIEVVTWIDRWRAASSVRKTRIVRVRDGAELARASTLWAFTSLETGSPARIPTSLRTSASGSPPGSSRCSTACWRACKRRGASASSSRSSPGSSM